MGKAISLACAAAIALVFGACERAPATTTTSTSTSTSTSTNKSEGVAIVAESSEAHHRVSELRERFGVLGAGVATAFVSDEAHTTMHAIIPADRVARNTHTAQVVLPMHANGSTSLTDSESRMTVRFAMRDANSAAVATVSEGVVLYRGGAARNGADVVHRVHAEGTEDFVVFESKPAREEITYDIDVREVEGIRFVPGANALELVDREGSPRLRVAPPYVVDARRVRHEARLSVEGCSYDTNPAAPWGRPITRPNASACIMHVSWSGIDHYPAMVDPAWTATGSLLVVRRYHTTTLLNTGLALIAGGFGTGGGAYSTAELYNPGTGTFAATGSMTVNRYRHSAALLATGNVLIVGGGASFNPSSPTCVLYNTGAGTFAATGSMAQGRTYATATPLTSGKVLVAAGYSENETTGVITMLSSAELYDPAGAGTFGGTGSLTGTRFNHTATRVASGKVIIAGGETNVAGTIRSTAELYDPAGAGTFSAAGNMTAARTSHVAVHLPASNKVLVAGGSNGTPISTAELYDAVANTFTATGSMSKPHNFATANLLLTGKALVVGGHDGLILTGTSEIFDPAGTFTTIGALTNPRFHHTSTVFASGKVLTAGGQIDPTFATATTSAELLNIVAAGSACTIGDDCTTGICEDNICCSAACSGTCKTCAAGTGACVNVTSADDPNTCTGVNTCDAAAACKLKTAQACPGGAATCATGFCQDGYCCGSACGGSCDVCNATPGTCTIAASPYAGNPSCAPLVCDGVSTSCPGGCATDANCAADSYCAANGACTPRKVSAAACNTTTDCKVTGCRVCAVGACADGVCCDQACTGTCEACTAALKQTGADGTCGPTKDGSNPRNTACPVDPPSSCGHDGKCSGSGGCRLYYPSGASCGVSQCEVNTNVVKGFICDGAGACADNQTGVDCAPFKCTAGTCNASCTTGADCASTGWCNNGLCEKKRDNGQTCTIKDACTSNICADGVCCNAPCNGQCEACDIPAAEGACAPVTGAVRGKRSACSTGDSNKPCTATVCDGTVRESCAGFVGPEVVCSPASCVNGTATGAGTCNQGACKTSDPVTCGAFACGATACNATCTKSEECAANYFCDTATSKCISAASCDGDHTTTDLQGAKTDCAPYRCESNGTCKARCAAVDDCVAPNVCDTDGKCIATPSSGEDSGCNISRARSTGRTQTTFMFAFFLGAALGVTLYRRRRRWSTSSRTTT